MEPRLGRLDELVRMPRNPRLHDLGELHEAYRKFGFLQRVVINDATGRMLAGMGESTPCSSGKREGWSVPKT